MNALSFLDGRYGVAAVPMLLVGIVMLRGVFSRLTASLAIATGVTGILYLGVVLFEGMAALRYVNAILALVFYLLAGVRLMRLGRA